MISLKFVSAQASYYAKKYLKLTPSFIMLLFDRGSSIRKIREKMGDSSKNLQI